MLIVAHGSHVGIEGNPRVDDSGDAYCEASLITNFDSNRSFHFLAPHCQDGPGMLRETAPGPPASPAQPSAGFEGSLRNAFRSLEGMRCDAAANIGEAYDRLHRVQAILAYLHIMKRRVPGISQILDEAKHTYEQALSWYEGHAFGTASGFAAASVSLCRIVEIVMSRSLRSDSTFPSLVPPPPGHILHSADFDPVEERLAETGSALSKIHWYLENGALPLEQRTQVRRIISWGEALHKQALHRYRQAALADAGELAEAALAGAQSVEHICKEWCIVRTAPPREQVPEVAHPR